MQIKPQRKSFLLGNTFPLAVILGTVALAGGAATFITPYAKLFLVPVFSLLLLVLIFYRETTVYAKENYDIRDDRILVRRGGLFSDSETELQLEHVTHIKWIRPWIRHKLFATGILQIEAAGSAANEVIFKDIEDSGQVYAEIRKRLHKNGFSMSTDTLMHRESPADLGIVAEMVTSGVGGFLGLALVAWPLLTAAIAAIPGIILLLPLLIAVGIFVLTMHYLDLKRRTYSIYNGLIEYCEGFLTKVNAVIPVENISNSEISRNIIDRLTDLYQVKVSCQGAGQEIRFRHLEHGERFDREIEKLVDQQSGSKQSEPEASDRGTDRSRTEEFSVSRDTETTGQFGMHYWRTLLPPLLCFILLPVLVPLFPLLILLIGYTIYELIRVKNTTYFLNKNSVQEKFEFFTSKSREFTTDKITGVTLRESILDKRFGTCSIKFWSIGAADEITFRNIPKSEQLQDMVLGKSGIHPENSFYSYGSKFSPKGMVLANLPAFALLTFLFVSGFFLGTLIHKYLAGVSIVSILVPVVWYGYGKYYYPRSRIELFENCVKFTRGLVVQRVTYALYPNVKDISTIKYPWLDNGQMRFNVAGERIRKTQYGDIRTPNGFTVNYVPEILNKDDVFDQLLLGVQEPAAGPVQPILTSGKAAANTVFSVLIVSLLLFPLLALLPLSLPIAVWRTRRVRYIIEPERVLIRKGVMYRKQTSIIFGRIDYIQTSQNFLNKLFKNGNIMIYTAGSSSPELVLRDIPNQKEFHKELRNYY